MAVEPFIGEIAIYAFNFAPRNWQKCEGQLINITDNPTLYSLLGTIYGGDGVTNFKLPDLRGRSIVGAGNGPGLQNINQGQYGGHESTAQVAAHSHTATLYGEKAAPDANNPADKLLGQSQIYTTPTSTKANKPMSAESIDVQSTGQASVNIRNPFLGLLYCIAIDGQYPPRD